MLLPLLAPSVFPFQRREKGVFALLNVPVSKSARYPHRDQKDIVRSHSSRLSTTSYFHSHLCRRTSAIPLAVSSVNTGDNLLLSTGCAPAPVLSGRGANDPNRRRQERPPITYLLYSATLFDARYRPLCRSALVSYFSLGGCRQKEQTVSTRVFECSTREKGGGKGE